MKKTSLFLLTATLIAGCGGDKTAHTKTPVPTDKQENAISVKAEVDLTPLELEQRGAKIYKRCRACHTLDKSGRNKVGPNLWDIYGSKAGSKEGYAYSKAMKAAGIVWDDETMDGYLKRPKDFMPGNKMSFIGLKKQLDRDAVQAYMKARTTP